MIAPLTIGVEEEFQLVDPTTGALVSRGDEVLAELRRDDGVDPERPAGEHGDADPGGDIVGELPLSQVETVTGVCHTLDDLRAAVTGLRGRADRAARRAGCRIAATATPPICDLEAQRPRSEDRYLHIREENAYLIREQHIAGMHIHLGVADDEARIRLSDGLRAHLPLLVALAGNSPYWMNQDTGFDSFRSIQWGRWPMSGMPPHWGSMRAHDDTVADLVTAGVVPDATRIYWDVRLSARFPTVEVRATDVLLTAADTVAMAGLVRAIGMSVLAAPPSPQPRHEVLVAAMWRAARFGLTGLLIDAGQPAARPAADVVGDALDFAADALEATGDRYEVTEAVQRWLSDGNGATRQRRAGIGGDLTAVVRQIVDATAG